MFFRGRESGAVPSKFRNEGRIIIMGSFICAYSSAHKQTVWWWLLCAAWCMAWFITFTIVTDRRTDRQIRKMFHVYIVDLNTLLSCAGRRKNGHVHKTTTADITASSLSQFIICVYRLKESFNKWPKYFDAILLQVRYLKSWLNEWHHVTRKI